MRAGLERRGSNIDRARRKRWLLATFDTDLGPEQCRCHLRLSSSCRSVLDYATVTADRIEPGGSYRHENIQPACPPCQNRQGALITWQRRQEWQRWMDEAKAAGIDWDGAL